MSVSDKTLGTIGLILSCGTLGYMFFHLMIVPILPLSDDNPLKLSSPPITLLYMCGIFGFSVIGTLLAYTFYILHKNRNEFNHVKK